MLRELERDHVHTTLGVSPTAQEEDKGEEKDEEWGFECICGKKGNNFDDGTLQISCEKCGVWQHISCLNFKTPTGRPVRGFNSLIFVCNGCKKTSFE